MNPRNRLINFRVTGEELERLKTASALKNARCLSDFARSVILDTVRAYDPSPEPVDGTAGHWRTFDRRLSELESRVSRLYDALATTVAVSR